MQKIAEKIPDIDEKDPSNWLDMHGNCLYRFALLRVKSPEIAEDLVQDTFVSAIRAVGNFEGKSSIRTWLVQILKNKIIDHARKDIRQPLSLMSDELAEVVEANFHSTGLWNRVLPNWAKDPDSLIEQKEFHQALQGCIEKLPKRARLVFISKIVDGIDSDELCKTLDISPSNLWVILHRARMALRSCLELNWFQTSQLKS